MRAHKLSDFFRAGETQEKIMKIKFGWNSLVVLFFFCFQSCKSSSRPIPSSLLPDLSTTRPRNSLYYCSPHLLMTDTRHSVYYYSSTSEDSSSSSSSSDSSRSSRLYSNSSSTSSSTSSSESESSKNQLHAEPHFFFRVGYNAMNKFMKVFLYWPHNFSLVVKEEFIPNLNVRKGILKFVKCYNRMVAVLISEEKALKLEKARKTEEISKLFKNIFRITNTVIFPEYHNVQRKVRRFLKKNGMIIVDINEFYDKFNIKKWEAGVKKSKFKGNNFFKWKYRTIRKFEHFRNYLFPTSITGNIEPRGKVLSNSLWPEMWTLIFFDVNHIDIIRYLFKDDVAYLISMSELRIIDGARLILKLENSELETLSSSQNIVEIIAEMKKEFATKTHQKLEYVLLSPDESIEIKNTFLYCGISVIHPNFTLSHDCNFDNFNHKGYGIVDISFNAVPLINAIAEYLDRKDGIHTFIPFDKTLSSDRYSKPRVMAKKQKMTIFHRGSIMNRDLFDEKLEILIKRDMVIESTLRYAKRENWRLFVGKRFKVEFVDELGIDGGGLTREWFTEIFKVIFDPSFGLFKVSESNQNVFYPNEFASDISFNLLEYFKFAGLMVGVAMNYPFQIGFQFTDSFLKVLLETPIKLHDLKDVDKGLYNFLCWLLDNNISEIHDDFYFVYEFDAFGEHRTIDLKEGGSKILLTDQNKFEFVDLVIRYVLIDRIKPQIDAFLSGFGLSVSKSRIMIFTVEELNSIISGDIYINVDDWERNTSYIDGFTSRSVQIGWFWQFMRTLDQKLLRKILQFSTGSATVPIEGFAALKGRDGLSQPFQISPASNKERLPIFKTCSNLIVIPIYDSYQTLVDKFMTALNEGEGIYTFG